MTGRTAGQDIRAANVVLMFELGTGFELVSRRLPGHVVDLGSRPQNFLRRAMAGYTPLHLKRGYLPDQRHSVYRAVTGRATDSLVHVNAVIEVDEVRQVVNAVPLEGFAGAPAFAYRLEVWAGGPYLRVAVDAGLGWRDAGEGRLLDGRVAVAAIDPQRSGVMSVTELNGLFAGDVGSGDVGRPIQFGEHPEQKSENEDGAEDAQPGNCVGARMKDLAHCPSVLTCNR